MLEDFRLKVFVTLSQEKSFTRTAEVLHISQPAVSQNISELEKQLGVKLFDRLRGEVALTPAGELFLLRANEILSKYDEISDIYMRLPETRVRVAASDEVYNYLTEYLLKNFLSIHPEVHFEMAFIDDHAYLKVNLAPVKEYRGMLALSLHPSDSFASTRLYQVLTSILVS